MPPPEAAEERLGILVVLSPEFTGLAGVGLLCHNLFTCQFLVHFEEAGDDVGLEESILDDAVFLEFSFGEFFCVVCGDVASIIENGAVVAF